MGGEGSRKGLRLALAKALQVQPAMISQVLKGHSHLSLEQAERANRFFGHSEEESEFFFLLVQKARAGTRELEKYFAGKIEELLRKRQEVVHRLGKRASLTKEEQSLYYSSWHFAAFHIAISVPALRSREALAAYFRLPPAKVAEVLERLCAMGLVTEKDGLYTYASENLRLGRDSHNILKHHANWRQQAMQALDRERAEDLHYSAVLSLSQEAQRKIKDLLLEGLKAQLALSEASPEEDVAVLCIDLFSLDQK
jgi:uncharacterized protein (TIGR02147 family)